MSNNQFNLAYSTDLNEGLKVVPILPVFISGDDQAHCFVISANRNGKDEPLTGATVRGYFIRPDDVTVTLDGSVNDLGQAVLSLNSSCYNKQGRFQIVIRAIIDGVKSTVFCGDGHIRLSSTDSFIDEEGIVPSLDDLLAQIETIEAAVNNANTAADRANTAAEKAENAKGDTGATPNLTIGTVETLAAGSNATATITGTAEDPVLNLGIPKGTDGMGAVQSVNGQTEVVVLTAEDVGAAPAGYGLGETTLDALENLNEAVAAGWYSFNMNTANAPYTGYGVVEVIPRYGGDTCLQRTHDLITTNSGFYNYGVSAERVYRDSAWQPWEYINPPMVLGVEYRTTERFAGLPVYKKYISGGWLGKGAQTIEHGIGINHPIEVQVFNHESENLTNDASTVSLYFSRSTVVYNSTADHGNVTFSLKYTKS